MASNKATYVTGADQDGIDMRRRNVPGYSASNGDVTQMPDSYDQDKKAKKVCSFGGTDRLYNKNSRAIRDVHLLTNDSC